MGSVILESLVKSFDADCDDADPSSRHFIDPIIDVAFFPLKGGDVNCFNLFPMRYMGSMNAVDLIIGEPVYKIGRSTGLTVGSLGSIQSSLRISGGRYDDHVQVLWNKDNCRFAFSMDCGSLYCVKRGPMYIPIAIHRISDANYSSYGCSFWKAMEYFPEEDNDVLETAGFVNAAPDLQIEDFMS
jgi:hypothetical protein